jgi:predicted O-linked N-acetylglucosamine transferase (SPINDLY family)
MATIPEALAIAVEHHQAGRLAAAEQIYRQILAVDPNESNAVNLLGVIAHQVGRPELAVELMSRAIQFNGSEATFHSNLGNVLLTLGELEKAVACCRRALELKPDFAEAHNNLGNALEGQGKVDDAAACYRRALDLKPDYPEAHNNLGNVLQAQGKPDEAIAAYRRALDLKPDYAEAHSNLGAALRDQGNLEAAIACYRRGLKLKPGIAEAHYNLGNVLRQLARLDEAAACYRRALELKPHYAEAHNNLGNALLDLAKPDEALACYRRAVELKPDYGDAHNNLGNAFQAQGNLDEAVASYRRAAELKPEFAEALSNLGTALKDQGNLDEAIACYRRALELKPGFAAAHSNLIYALNFCPGVDARAIYEEQHRWEQQHAAPLAGQIQPHSNERSADRPLRIGYVSPDFREHVVGRFMLPLLEAHDYEYFEIYCYASVRLPDAMTDRCRAQADVWRNAAAMTDEQLAQMIRDDQIDILVDLAMHTAGNRLLAFARKPAPVQVAYLAYAGATGLSTMDYCLTDRYLDPPGERAGDDERIYGEELIRLPDTYWCYRAPALAPAVNPLPALEAGHITFGCFNTFSKVTEPTLAAWIELLAAAPASRLLLHANAGHHRERARELFARHGIAHDRVTFVDRVPAAEYFGLYHRVDVALDPFPFGGGTTTCDALWMGVPVVSLAGQTSVGRGGLSILSNVELAELVASDREQYIRIAQQLAGDLPRLSQLRATLQDRMRGSPLTDVPRFARHLEAAYRAMWRRWCAG